MGVEVSMVSGTYNRLPLLQRMIQSAREAAGTLQWEFVIVDGGSTDGTIEWLKEQDDVVLIEHGELKGSARAYQDGFERAAGRRVATLNDDVTVEKPSITKAYQFLNENPGVGQVAFGHKYQRRGRPTAPVVQRIFQGYPYAQCGMIRRWLGDVIGWCGIQEEGYKHYGWDNYLSARVWEAGWRVVAVPGCSVTDWEHEDDLRKINNDGPREGNEGRHPDAVAFGKHWRNRLPKQDQWIPASNGGLARSIVIKALHGKLRTLRFKATMFGKSPMRRGCIDAFAKYGESYQVDQSAAASRLGKPAYQVWAIRQIKDFKPDLVMLQAQRQNNIQPGTIQKIREQFPNTYVFNWDGDTHFPLKTFHHQTARACHLQLCVSPTLFADYIAHEASNIGYWPIGVEREFLQVERAAHPQGPAVVFLGALYGLNVFPEAETRRDAVLYLYRKGLLEVQGTGWQSVGIKASYTGEQFKDNAQLYANCKMALSISQSKDLWGYTSDRLYNICGVGCPALVQRFAGMEEHGFVDGESCIAWTTFREMEDKMRYYLEHVEEREAIGRAGKQLILTRHNWDERVKELWRMILDYGE